MKFKNRYDRNHITITEEDNKKLLASKVAVIGCGGLGGYIIEMLARMGVGHIVCVDGDEFDETNLNRQLISKEDNIGKSKANEAKIRVESINSEVTVTAIHDFFKEENGKDILNGCAMAYDALDNMNSRRELQNITKEMNIPVIHGAIAGWYGQLSVIFPEDDGFEKILPQGENKGAEVELGNPSFTPALIASMEVAEGTKILLNKEGEILKNQLLTIDLLYHDYEITEL